MPGTVVFIDEAVEKFSGAGAHFDIKNGDAAAGLKNPRCLRKKCTLIW